MTKSVTIKAAWIGAIALIIAALIALFGDFFGQKSGVKIKTEGKESTVVVGNENTTTVQKIDNYYNIEGDATILSDNEIAGYVKNDIKKVHSPKQEGLVFKVYGEEVFPEEGKIYTVDRKGSKLSYMLKDGLVHVQYTKKDGTTGYYVVDGEGRVVEKKFPYPLQEYTIQIPEDMEIRRETQTLPNGFRKVHVVLKWDRTADYILDQAGKLQQLSIEGDTHVDNINKLISPRKLEGN